MKKRNVKTQQKDKLCAMHLFTREGSTDDLASHFSSGDAGMGEKKSKTAAKDSLAARSEAAHDRQRRLDLLSAVIDSKARAPTAGILPAKTAVGREREEGIERGGGAVCASAKKLTAKTWFASRDFWVELRARVEGISVDAMHDKINESADEALPAAVKDLMCFEFATELGQALEQAQALLERVDSAIHTAFPRISARTSAKARLTFGHSAEGGGHAQGGAGGGAATRATEIRLKV